MAYVLINQVGVYRTVDLDEGWLGLPVSTKDDYGFRLHLVRDLFSDGLEDRVDGVIGFVHDCRLDFAPKGQRGTGRLGY